LGKDKTFICYLQAMTAKNKLGLFDFTMIVVSLVIGMGIFRNRLSFLLPGLRVAW